MIILEWLFYIWLTLTIFVFLFRAVIYAISNFIVRPIIFLNDQVRKLTKKNKA